MTYYTIQKYNIWPNFFQVLRNSHIRWGRLRIRFSHCAWDVSYTQGRPKYENLCADQKRVRTDRCQTVGQILWISSMNISLLSQNASQTCVSNRFFNTSSLSPCNMIFSPSEWFSSPSPGRLFFGRSSRMWISTTKGVWLPGVLEQASPCFGIFFCSKKRWKQWTYGTEVLKNEICNFFWASQHFSNNWMIVRHSCCWDISHNRMKLMALGIGMSSQMLHPSLMQCRWEKFWEESNIDGFQHCYPAWGTKTMLRLQGLCKISLLHIESQWMLFFALTT